MDLCLVFMINNIIVHLLAGGRDEPFDAHCCHMGTVCQSAQMSKLQTDGLTWSGRRMLYSCTHMATVGVKGLM